MPDNKNHRLRIRYLDQLLRSHTNRTREELIERLIDKIGLRSLSESSLNKDLRYLRDQGAEIVIKDKRYSYKDKSFSIESHPLNEEDHLMLDFAMMILSAYKHSPIFTKFGSTVERIVTGSRLEKLNGQNQPDIIQTEYSLSSLGMQWLELIYKAIIDEQSLEIIYQKFGSPPLDRVISPYLLKEYRNRWYLVGYTKETQYSSVYALDRMLNVVGSDKPYYKDPKFNREEYFRNSLGVFHFHNIQPEKVILEFYADHIDYIQTQPLHTSQKSVLNAERQCLNVELTVFITPEVKSLILSYGSGVKVLAPESLRDYIQSESAKTGDLYKL